MLLRFFFSCQCLCVYLIIALASLYFVCRVGPDVASRYILSFADWLRGGEYQGFAVLSVVFAMNTWGLAVKSTRRKVRLACRNSLSSQITRLKSGEYLLMLDERVSKRTLNVWTAFWLRRLEKNITRYKDMIPEMLEISSALTEILMAMSAIVAVVCMILSVNGRFAAFLLLPYPMFWLYSKYAVFWVRCRLSIPMFFLSLTGLSADQTFDSASFSKTLTDVMDGFSAELESR